MGKSSKYISGALAFGIYFALIGLIFFYFNVRKSEKSIHFVEKNEQRIQVSLGGPAAKSTPQPKPVQKPTPKPIQKPTPKPKPKPVEKPKPAEKPKPKPEPKPVEKPTPKPEPKAVPKPVEKPKPAEKPKPKPEPKPVSKPTPKLVPKTQPKVNDLFAKVNAPQKKELIKVTDKPVIDKPKNDLIKVSDKPSASQLVSNSLKIQKNSDSGVENAYFAKIEKILQGWPAQSEFAGEKAKVWFKVQVDGSFEFRILTGSSISAFNEGLEGYLRQLQKIGFGRHQGGRPYELEVDFVANE
ncbi:MAG: TonB C-terminal domain-containing protein [Campylobacterales bacterium]|nr:TonB C-terminal domain-containing protein [Campylobacterales bacterium]